MTVPTDDATGRTIDAARHGDGRAVDSLLERHLPALTAFLRTRVDGVVARRESVRDLVQSVCREVPTDLADFEYRGEESFRAWLFLMASRKLVDRHRYYRQDKRDVRAEELAGDAAESLVQRYASICTPSRQASAQEYIVLIEDALGSLPPAQREAILLSRIAEVSYAEIARQKGCDESAVRRLVARGLARLSLLLPPGSSLRER
jgi:RNA polymerase sigma-70 factor (ECF subfamily)